METRGAEQKTFRKGGRAEGRKGITPMTNPRNAMIIRTRLVGKL